MKKMITGFLLMGILLTGGCGSNADSEPGVGVSGSSVESSVTTLEENEKTSEASPVSAKNTSTSAEPKNSKETSETKETAESKATEETKESGETKETTETRESEKPSKQTDKGSTKENSTPSTQSKTAENSRPVDKAESETKKEDSQTPQENNSNNAGSSTPEPAHTTCTWDGGKVTAAASCSSGGEKTYTCTVCGKTRTESISASGHSMTTETTAASCTAAGTSKTYCKVCGYVESETANGSPTGHSYGEVTWFLPQTCTTTGYWNQVCTVCGDAIGGNGDSTLPHSWDGGDKGGAPCQGYGVIYTCTVCGLTRTEELPPDGDHVDSNGDGFCDNCPYEM